jgi:hypothetical protein
MAPVGVVWAQEDAQSNAPGDGSVVAVERISRQVCVSLGVRVRLTRWKGNRKSKLSRWQRRHAGEGRCPNHRRWRRPGIHRRATSCSRKPLASDYGSTLAASEQGNGVASMWPYRASANLRAKWWPPHGDMHPRACEDEDEASEDRSMREGESCCGGELVGDSWSDEEHELAEVEGGDLSLHCVDQVVGVWRKCLGREQRIGRVAMMPMVGVGMAIYV